MPYVCLQSDTQIKHQLSEVLRRDLPETGMGFVTLQAESKSQSKSVLLYMTRNRLRRQEAT